MTSAARATQLRKAMRERQLVRFKSRFEQSKIRGYVRAVGPRFFLLAVVSDRLHFDGHECFRIADINGLQPDPYGAFAEAALKKRGEKLGRAPRIDLSDIAAILRSAAKASPLVTIHIEKIDPDVCYIGRVHRIDDKRVVLREIRPDASWWPEPYAYRLRDITRVNFGGDYEDALTLVGGKPPRLRNS